MIRSKEGRDGDGDEDKTRKEKKKIEESGVTRN